MKIVLSIIFFLASINVYAIGDCAAKVKLYAEVLVRSGNSPTKDHFIPNGSLTSIVQTENPHVVRVTLQSQYGGRQSAVLYVQMSKVNHCEILGILSPKF